MQLDSTATLSNQQLQYLDTIPRLYEQQQTMYATQTRRCDDRIVSLHQPYVRPIVRGKASAVTEFGAKLTISYMDGYADITRLSWDAYNESHDLAKAAEDYKGRYRYCPQRMPTPVPEGLGFFLFFI